MFSGVLSTARGRPRRATRRDRRRAWLAAVGAALAEADTILDELSGEEGDAAEVRARVAAAREVAAALGAGLRCGSVARRRAPARDGSPDPADG
ncbi:hypothetical protein [Sphingomonas sp.]|uniref:hypothetical protein n=1 Tax=Sphingomonas sp. TaxID=28214 RepID=UPI003B007FDF